MSGEKNIQSRIMLALGGHPAVRIFRNNTGVAWMGEARRISNRGPVMLNPGDVVIRNARRVEFGLCKGSSDLIGWRNVTVTPEMVGQRIAQFLAVEVKTGKGRATPEQLNFLRVLAGDGGAAGVARSPEEALALVEDGLFASGDSQTVKGR
jgi:hypothetical protein